MKNLLFLLLLAAPLVAFARTADYTPAPSMDEIARALNSGDVDALSRHFAADVKVSINDNEQTYAKHKATEVVRAFFNSARPQSFNKMHQGNSREGNGGQYCIGDLAAGTGKYRVYVYLKAGQIAELRFDKD